MKPPKKVNNLHEQAMIIADDADKAVELYQQAASHSNRCQSFQLLARSPF